MDDLGGKPPLFLGTPMYILKLALEEKVKKKTQFTEKLAKAEIQKLFRIEFVKNPF